MKPLNLYLDSADEERREAAVIEYGNAIKELAYANIFPGDMLFKNFGVTRFGRVVFYDYDEIEYMTDCNFRRIPPPPNPEAEMSGEAWYSVGPRDVFPRSSAPSCSATRTRGGRFHEAPCRPARAGVLAENKQKILDGFVPDFFPYPEEMRFCRMLPTRLAVKPRRREPSRTAARRGASRGPEPRSGEPASPPSLGRGPGERFSSEPPDSL
jgi:isocitrate dehydrogenase kinase/phosphatase